MNLKPAQVILIGTAIVFGLPIIVGFIVGHFAGPLLGIVSGGIVLLLVILIAHRQLMKGRGKD